MNVSLPGNPGQRISVVGTTGSGKTMIARFVSRRLGVPHVELDSLYWGPDWTPPSIPVFRNQVAEALRGTRWVCDGNYSRVRDIVWSRADTIVWLDYPLAVIMWQLIGRTVRRARSREVLWQGNRESWRTSFLSQDSILLWALKSFRRRRREYPTLMRKPEHAHLRTIHLRSRSATGEWLHQFGPTIAGP